MSEYLVQCDADSAVCILLLASYIHVHCTSFVKD